MGDPELSTAIQGAVSTWRHGARGAVEAWNRSLIAMEHVDRNANQATLIESWAADLAQLTGR